MSLEGRIPGFNAKWNKRKNDVINKEDRLRWKALDSQLAIMEASGKPRKSVNLGRSHSCIGPFPGCRRIAELSPRKSASMCFLEQKLERSSAADPANPSTRELLYHGITSESQGRHQYLKIRQRDATVQERFGHLEPLTANMHYGFKKPVWPASNNCEYRASKHCHKPKIEGEFFRPNGAITHQNLPDPIK